MQSFDLFFGSVDSGLTQRINIVNCRVPGQEFVQLLEAAGVDYSTPQSAGFAPISYSSMPEIRAIAMEAGYSAMHRIEKPCNLRVASIELFVPVRKNKCQEPRLSNCVLLQ